MERGVSHNSQINKMMLITSDVGGFLLPMLEELFPKNNKYKTD